MTLLRLLISLFATWRLTSLFVYEAGPFDVFTRLRQRAGVQYDERSNVYGTNVVSKMLICPKCASLWMALVVALVVLRRVDADLLLHALALSGGTIVLNDVVGRLES
jgi:hypothetical protein